MMLKLVFLALALCILGVVTFETKSCSDNGVKYVDSLACECYQCYSGETCADFDETCVLDLGAGQPELAAEYWEALYMSGAMAGSTSILAPYRNPYQIGLGTVFKYGSNPKLVEIIRKVHAAVGNAETEGYEIVVGAGASQLIVAAMYAHRQLAGRDLTGFAKVPHYNMYPGAVDQLVKGMSWNSSTTLNPADVVEMVTSPNNPDCQLRTPYFQNSAGAVFDMVYYWPSYMGNGDPIVKHTEDIMLFSMSKMAGDAGGRLGWALVKDPAMAEAMYSYISASVIHVPVESQLRTMQLLSAQLDQGFPLFSFIRCRLDDRWDRVRAVFTAQSASVVGVSGAAELPAYPPRMYAPVTGAAAAACPPAVSTTSFYDDGKQAQRQMQRLRAALTSSPIVQVLPSSIVNYDEDDSARFSLVDASKDGFYLWIRCNRPSEAGVGDGAATCFDVFKAAGIAGESGTSYYDEEAIGASYVRLHMMLRDAAFELFMQRLQMLLVTPTEG